jgi:integrase
MVMGERRDKLFPDATKESYREAVLWEKETQKELEETQTAMGCLTIFDWSEEYLDYAKERFAVKTYKEKKYALSRLCKFFIPELAVENLSPSMVLSFLRTQAKARSGNASNKDRKNLSAAWEWGRKYLNDFPKDSINPFRSVDKFPEKRSPRYVPSEDDFWKVYDVAEGQDQIMLLTYLHLAARKKEIFNLTWADIDFGNNQIRLWTTKREGGNQEADWLPMTSELRSSLMGWWQDRPVKDSSNVFVCLDDKPVNEHLLGKPFTSRQHIMKSLCKKAKVKPFGFHAIRHLTASILYHKGYDVAIIQAILRHKSPTTTNRYLKSLGLEHTRKALEEGLKGPAKVIQYPKKTPSEMPL